MKLVLVSLAALSLLTAYGIAGAGPNVPSVAALQAADFGSAHTLVLNGYHAGSTTGGGILTATQESVSDGCLTYADRAGHRFRRTLNGKPLDVTMCGARCGGMQVSDGRSVVGSPVITSATARWTRAIVGWRAVVSKAGPAGKQIDTTVAGVNAFGSLTLALPAGAAGSDEVVSLYPDDTVALDTAFTVAGKAKIFVQLPPGGICGYANPAASVYKEVAGLGLLLNGGALWLAHTGPVIDTGVGLRFTANASVLKGPGKISGLYQTDQGTPQFNTAAVVFASTSGSTISGDVIIQNTKGRGFLAETVKDFSVTDVTVRDCGDFSFQPPADKDIMLGRSMCGQVTAPSGTLTVRNYTGINAAQAGLLVYGPTEPNFRASISNCHFSGNGYYGLDLEEISGSVNLSDCEHIGNGRKPSRQLIYGGYIIRDVEKFYGTNVKSSLTDSNAFVIQSVDSKANLQEWRIDGLTLTGTPTSHAASLYMAIAHTGTPQRVSLNDVVYDTWSSYFNGAPCLPSVPRQQLLSLQNVRASGLYKGTPTQLNFQANPGQKTYVQGRDSNLGITTVKTLAGNQNAIHFDLANVRIIGFSPGSAPFHC